MSDKKKSYVNCSVFGCKSLYSTSSTISFHYFPKENEPKVLWENKFGKKDLVNRRQMWAIKLRMGKETLKKRTSESAQITLMRMIFFVKVSEYLTIIIFFG